MFFSEYLRCLDDFLSGEMFHSFRKIKLRLSEPKTLEFPKLNARKVEVDVSDRREFMLL